MAAARPPAPARHEADRRQVTILFADVSGFTALAERLDAEDVHAFQGALFEMLGKATTSQGGFVDKFMGDGVLAVFGAPIAHEDDAERALRAALEMQARMHDLSARWQRRLGQPVVLHIAAHTGPVVAGSLEHATGAGYELAGDTVNTASRLLGAAGPGIILVSETTYTLTQHAFAFGSAGTVPLRGKRQPLAVHRLTGVLDRPGSARGLAGYGLAAPLIGRAREIEALIDGFERMQGGAAQLVCVVGEAGMGKSRLLAEFLERLEANGRLAGTALRRAACSSLGEPTYGLFGALFRQAYGVAPDDSVAAAREKLAAELRRLGAAGDVVEAIAPVMDYVLGIDEMRPRDLDPEQLKRQIGLAARMLLERRLRQGPLLIVAEDVHWADTASVDLLRDVAANLADQKLMIVLTQRPEAPPLPEPPAPTIIRLSPLGTGDTQRLVGGLFGEAADDSLKQVLGFVASRAGGNPLFTEEIVRSLVDRGVLVRHAQHWTCAAPCDALDVPPTLQGLLLSRVDRLPPAARHLLQEAAVLGVEFEEDLLASVTGDPRAIAGTLLRLTEANLIQPAAGAARSRQHRFAHALVRDAIYQSLLRPRREELHTRAGTALERATGPHPQRLSDVEALAHHWSLSADRARGARYLVAAGDWARGLYANKDAIRHYRRALATLADCEDCGDQVRTVRERLADLLALSGDRGEALSLYESIRIELDGADRAGEARLLRKIGGLHWEAGDRTRAGTCFAAGLARLGDDGAPIERAQLFQELGRLAFRGGDNPGAIAWAERSLAEASREPDGGDPEQGRELAATRAHAYNTLGVALARTGLLGEAVERIERSVVLAEEHDLLQAACRGYTNLGVLYSSLDPPRSIETCLRGLEAAKKVGHLGFQSHLYTNLAVAYCALTNRCEAEGMIAARTAIELDRRLGLLDHLAVPLIVLGQIHQCHGETAPAFAYYREALALAERAGEPQLLFPCYDGLATLYLDVGDSAQAEIFLAKSQEVCQAAGLKPEGLMVLPFLC